jgi:hypothetical protein
MQFAKDSFYVSLRERLSALNPTRRMLVNGAERIALVVPENEIISESAPSPNAFYLRWGGVRQVDKHAGGKRPLKALECTISYFTSGTCESGVDRGRMLATLDTELLTICQPPESRKRDYTQLPSRDLGTYIFWSVPEVDEKGEKTSSAFDADKILERSARLTLFFFPEVDVP